MKCSEQNEHQERVDPKKPRAGWEEASKKMANCGDDLLLDETPDSLTIWDVQEWEW